jgi:hypothetical protein
VEPQQVLVTGSGNPFIRSAESAARIVGRALAEYGFGLVTGNAPGVDKVVSKAFCDAAAPSPGSPLPRFTQICLPWHQRGGLWPVRAFAAPAKCRIEVADEDAWLNCAHKLAGAAVILSGGGGTKRIANRFIERGKPVFPVPFTGGTSSKIFLEVLSRWASDPVPGLTRDQFLRLAVPWTSDTGALPDLLLGTLSASPSIFVSYRRADTEWIAGRLRKDLADRFGKKRVFMDLDHIEPGDDWERRIENALVNCTVGIVIVGPQWFANDPRTSKPRVFDATDVLRREVERLIDMKKALFVLTTPDAPPQPWTVPDGLMLLRRIQTLTITSHTWDAVLEKLIDNLRPLLLAAARTAASPPAPQIP